LLNWIAVGGIAACRKGAELLVAGAHDGAEERFLVGEVQVQRVWCHAGARGDGAHGQLRLVAELEQQVARGVEQCSA
jgi:hypothetical protein